MLAGGSKTFLVRASYLEIYNEEIRDLLSKNPQQRLELKEHPDRGVYVRDLMQFVVKSVAEFNSVLQVSHQGVVDISLTATVQLSTDPGKVLGCHSHVLANLMLLLLTGRQEEPHGGCYPDESGQLSFTFYIHNHHRSH